MSLSSPNRRARRVAIALTVCLGSSLFGVTLASAQSDNATRAGLQPAAYVVRKANLGLAPGAGFFLDPVNIKSGLNDLKTLGVHWIRSTIPWQNFQPDDPQHLAKGKPTYNWKGVDQLAATLREPAYRGRFSLIVTVENPPAWAKVPQRVGHIACSAQAPFDLPSYARATAALAAHMKGTAHVFEVENSPNIGKRSPAHGGSLAAWPIPNPCGYAQLLKLTTMAVHALHIGALVLVGGIGGEKDIPQQRMAADHFLAALYQYGAHGAFDGVSFHPYSTPQLPCAPSKPICVYDPSLLQKDPYGMTNGWDRMLSARQIMVAHHDGAKKMWITEFGGPTAGPRGSVRVLTDAQQAALLTAGFQRASQYSWVAVMSWFTYSDKGGNQQADPIGGWMGLLDQRGARKPAFAAYVRLAASAK
jgi:polysaccharide biosynthesis protein PslG